MYSKEHINYLKNIKKNKIIITISQILIIVIFLIIWQLLADLKIINTFIFSSPKKVIETIISLYKSKNLFSHIWVTIYETILSFSIATILGTIIATILWWFNKVQKIIEPYLTILNSLPKVALGPIIIIWFGAGIKSIIFMALLISLIITIINVYEGFNSTNQNKIKLMKTLGAKKCQIFFKLIFPNSINTIINALKINVSMSLIGVIMGEFLVSKKGIGYLILYGSQVFNLSLVISGIFILCIVAALMYYLVSYLERKVKKR
jgi:NitT/TauT family transport system permease protein